MTEVHYMVKHMWTPDVLAPKKIWKDHFLVLWWVWWEGILEAWTASDPRLNKVAIVAWKRGTTPCRGTWFCNGMLNKHMVRPTNIKYILAKKSSDTLDRAPNQKLTIMNAIKLSRGTYGYVHVLYCASHKCYGGVACNSEMWGGNLFILVFTMIYESWNLNAGLMRFIQEPCCL